MQTLQTLNESKVVAQISEVFALELGFSSHKSRLIGKAAELHDVGKIRICNSILTKPNALTPAEYEIMKMHTKLGAQMLTGLFGEFGVMARIVAEFHHEDIQGTGYWKISTSELPAYIPIISLSDIYVALRSKRPYKPAWTQEQTLEYLHSQATVRFCPKLTSRFIRMISKNPLHDEVFCGKIVLS